MFLQCLFTFFLQISATCIHAFIWNQTGLQEYLGWTHATCTIYVYMYLSLLITCRHITFYISALFESRNCTTLKWICALVHYTTLTLASKLNSSIWQCLCNYYYKFFLYFALLIYMGVTVHVEFQWYIYEFQFEFCNLWVWNFLGMILHFSFIFFVCNFECCLYIYFHLVYVIVSERILKGFWNLLTLDKLLKTQKCKVTNIIIQVM